MNRANLTKDLLAFP